MNQAQQNQDELLERTLREAGSIGKTWARYGLVVGKTALETSAITLKKVAGLLDDLSAQFKDTPSGDDVVVAQGETVADEPAPQTAESVEPTEH
jgi:hypothetical protein